MSCSSESVVVTCIIVRVVEQWRVWPKAWQQMHAQVEQQALLCKRDAAGTWRRDGCVVVVDARAGTQGVRRDG